MWPSQKMHGLFDISQIGAPKVSSHFSEEILLRVVTLVLRYVVVNKGEKNQDVEKL